MVYNIDLKKSIVKLNCFFLFSNAHRKKKENLTGMGNKKTLERFLVHGLNLDEHPI